VKRVDLYRLKLKMAQAELKIVARKANTFNKRQATLAGLINELEKKIAVGLLAKT
jgi:hypothetical protein